jgi:DNA gyrase subunit A
MAVEDLRVMGRATQGVKLINIKGNDSIAAVTKVMKDDEVELKTEDGIIEGVASAENSDKTTSSEETSDTEE